MKTLQRFIQAQERREFAYGTFDCCTFVADCVHTMTGADPMRELRGQYNERSQIRLLQRLGGLSGAVSHYLGAASLAPSLCRDGDVVLVPGINGRTALGVFLNGYGLSPAAHGLQSFPVASIICAWRLP